MPKQNPYLKNSQNNPQKKAKKVQKSTLTKEEVKKIKRRMAELKANNRDSTQSFIPYLHMYSDGICHVRDKFYTKTVQFFDINYRIASFDDAHKIFSSYCNLLNYFDDSIKVQLSFENQNTDIDEMNSKLTIPLCNDDDDDIRQEYSEMQKKQMLKGKNGKILKKYITLGIDAENVRYARIRLVNIVSEVKKLFKKFDVACRDLNGEERLELLYKSLNPFSDEPFIYDRAYMKKTGMDTKDFIAPSSLKIAKNHFELGNGCYGMVSALNVLSGEMSDEILSDFLQLDNVLALDIHLEPYDQTEAIKLIKGKLSDLGKMKIDEQKKAFRSGYDPDILPPALVSHIDSTESVLADLQSKSERLFKTSFLIRSYSSSKKKMEVLQETLTRTAQKNNCKLLSLEYRQESAFASTLPIGYNAIPVSRLLTTAAVAGFVPFTTKELFQGATATYYGLNALSNNLIMALRTSLDNPNGIILGMPGSGKSFFSKREIIDIYLKTDSDIFICDPEGEYIMLVNKLKGEVIDISFSSEHRINPMEVSFFDMRNAHTEEERKKLEKYNDEIIASKSDFICTLMEVILGKRDLTSEERTLTDRCVCTVLKRFLANGARKENMPILEDLWMEFKKSGGVGSNLAVALDLYVSGTQNLFNCRSTVDINNRIICFNIRNMSEQLKDLAMLIIQDTVWDRVSRNRETGKYTYYYIDEFHLLLKEKQTANYCVTMWKRFRKWHGVPTGMTQNVKDFLNSLNVENIIDNSHFVCMLNQSAGDREILKNMLKLSDEQLSYIYNQDRGHGLLKFGEDVIPFKDEFPRDSLIYALITTDPEDKELVDKARKILNLPVPQEDEESVGKKTITLHKSVSA